MAIREPGASEKSPRKFSIISPVLRNVIEDQVNPMAQSNTKPQTAQFHAIPEALEDIKAGKGIILVDDEDRENEGDLVLAAEKVTADCINFMAMYGRGLICLALTPDRVEELKLPPQTNENTAPFGTAFTVSIDAAKNITTGISAADRATTIKLAVDPSAKPNDFARPGHIFPLKAHKGGVLRRAGQTEGSVDLARMAGLYPGGVICEIMNDDGTMARVPHLMEFAKNHRPWRYRGTGCIGQYFCRHDRITAVYPSLS